MGDLPYNGLIKGAANVHFVTLVRLFIGNFTNIVTLFFCNIVGAVPLEHPFVITMSYIYMWIFIATNMFPLIYFLVYVCVKQVYHGH